VKRTIVEAVGPQGSAVLNAADPHVAAMAEHCPGRVVFFGLEETLPAIAAHRRHGGRALFVRDGRIVLAEGADEFEFVRLDRVPLTHGGTVRFQVENTLAAVGAGWALGLSLEMMATRVDNFSANQEQSPGRFNVFDVQGTTVVLDYGHNSSALLALIDALSRFPHERRTVVYSTAGDRRDCDIVRQGELLGAAFDRVILYEDHYKRGRRDGEIMALFRQGIAKSARATVVEDVHGAVASVEHAFRTKRPGELLVVQPDVVDETVDFLRRYLHELAQSQQTPVGERVAEAAPVAARHL
jgi:cyanophycin synthetase